MDEWLIADWQTFVPRHLPKEMLQVGSLQPSNVKSSFFATSLFMPGIRIIWFIIIPKDLSIIIIHNDNTSLVRAWEVYGGE